MRRLFLRKREPRPTVKIQSDVTSNDTASTYETKPADWKLHGPFPFMAPVLLWRVMALAGFFVYGLCTLYPPNPFTGGSQLNAALTLFQSILLWKAPNFFNHSGRRTLSLACFLGYAASAGVTLSDMLFSRTYVRLVLWSGSFVMFYLAAQASMVYLILDDQSSGNGRVDDVGILHHTFHFKDEVEKEREGKQNYMTTSGLPPWRVVMKAFGRVFLLTSLSFCVAMLGKFSHEVLTLALFS